MTSTNGILEFLDDSLTKIRQEKAASYTEAGGYSGPSTHPSAKKDDGSQTAPEGARSSENTADVKKDQGPPAVDSAQGAEEGDHQYNIGQQQSATGEDASIEDPDKINKKDDDGYKEKTTHPASGDTDQGKQASDELGDSILAQIAVFTQGEKTAAEGAEYSDDQKNPADDNKTPATEDSKEADGKLDGGAAAKPSAKKDEDDSKKYASEEEKKAAEEKAAAEAKANEGGEKKADEEGTKEDFEAGREAAKLAAETLQGTSTKVTEVTAQIQKSAGDDADLFCQYLTGYTEGREKAAMGPPYDEGHEEEKGESHKDEEKDKEEDGDGEGGEEGGAEMDAGSAMTDMAGGGEPAGAPGGMPPEIAALMGGAPGGMPPEAAMMGGMPGGMPPEAMMGGAGGGMPGGGMPGGISEEELMMALQQVLAEGQAGGMPVPPEAMKAAQEKVAAAKVRDGQRKQAAADRNIKLAAAKDWFRKNLSEVLAAAPAVAG